MEYSKKTNVAMATHTSMYAVSFRSNCRHCMSIMINHCTVSLNQMHVLDISPLRVQRLYLGQKNWFSNPRTLPSFHVFWEIHCLSVILFSGLSMYRCIARPYLWNHGIRHHQLHHLCFHKTIWPVRYQIRIPTVFKFVYIECQFKETKYV